jgi:BASS family bile acid:Na+ symporter
VADILDLSLRLSVMVFMLGSLGGVGLGLVPRDAMAPLGHTRFIVRSMAASWFVAPAAAWLLVQVVPLERPYAVGLLLLALAPCAPFAPATVQIAGGSSAYLAAFMLLSAVSTVILMPLGVPLLVPGLSVAAAAIARPLVLFVLLPLFLGMFVRAVRPQAAERTTRPVALVTNAAGLLLLVLIVVIHGRGVIDAIGSYAIAVQLVFLVAITAAAHALGAGLADEQRSVLTLGVGTRNLGAALAPLMAFDSDPRAVVMIALGAPLTIAISTLTARWLARHGRHGLLPAPGRI